MKAVDPEQAAADIRGRAGVRVDELVGAVGLADRYLGDGRVLLVDPTEVWGDGEVTEDGYILVRGGLDDPAREFTVFHEIAEHWVARATLPPMDHRAKETACDAIAAALLAPAPVFSAAVREHGALALAALATDFRATQTAMALRLGEVERHPVRVEKPGVVRARGLAVDWNAAVRRAVRVRITDAPDRVAYLVVA